MVVIVAVDVDIVLFAVLNDEREEEAGQWLCFVYIYFVLQIPSFFPLFSRIDNSPCLVIS